MAILSPSNMIYSLLLLIPVVPLQMSSSCRCRWFADAGGLVKSSDTETGSLSLRPGTGALWSRAQKRLIYVNYNECLLNTPKLYGCTCHCFLRVCHCHSVIICLHCIVDARHGAYTTAGQGNTIFCWFYMPLHRHGMQMQGIVNHRKHGNLEIVNRNDPTVICLHQG